MDALIPALPPMLTRPQGLPAAVQPIVRPTPTYLITYTAPCPGCGEEVAWTTSRSETNQRLTPLDIAIACPTCPDPKDLP